MKATEQCFPVSLFIMLCKLVVLTFESVDEIRNCCQFPGESFPVVLFAILCCGSGGVCYDNTVTWWF